MAGPTRGDRSEPREQRAGGENEGPLDLGPIFLDPRSREVRVDGLPVQLTPTEFRLLHILARPPGWVRSAEELMATAWGDSSYFEPGLVSVHISRLRRKLGSDPANPGFIKTVRGLGYRLELPLTPVSVAPEVGSADADARSGGRDRSLLETAAVLGRPFHVWALAKLMGAETEDLLEPLDDLVTRGVIAPSAEVGEYEFVSEEEAARVYSAILPGRRFRLHLAAAEWLGQRPEEEHDEESLNRLNHHFLNAIPVADLSWVLRYARDLGALHLQRQQSEPAVELLVRALALLKQHPPANQRERSLAADVAELHGDLLRSSSQWEQAVEAYERSVRLDQPLVGLAGARRYRKIGMCFEAKREFGQAFEAFAAAESHLDNVSESSARNAGSDWWREWVEIQLARMWAQYYEHSTEELNTLVEATMETILAHGTPEQVGWLYGHLLSDAFLRERYQVSDQVLHYAQILYEQLEAGDSSPTELAFARFGLGFAYLWRRQLADAEGHLSAALAGAESAGDQAARARTHTYLGVLHRFRGDVAKCAWSAHAALRAAVSGGAGEYVSASHANLAWVALRRGSIGSARAKALDALRGWREQQTLYPFQWMALCPMVELDRRAEDHPAALGHLKDLLAPSQQRLPGELEGAAERAVELGAESDQFSAALDEVCAIAAELGYI